MVDTLVDENEFVNELMHWLMVLKILHVTLKKSLKIMVSDRSLTTPVQPQWRRTQLFYALLRPSIA